MRKPKIIIYWFLSLLAISLSCKIYYVENSSCPIEHLFINASDIPGDHWQEIGPRNYRGAPYKLGIERSGTSFSTPTNGIVVEQIYRFTNNNDAITGFNKFIDRLYRLEPQGASWEKLEIPNNISFSATKYKLECSIRINQTNKSCWFISLFEKTIIFLKVDMVVITNDDLFSLIELLNTKINTCPKINK